ncbi:MAG: hypothetical protein GQ574_15090, partial [Crocinitomix sp.]|nr:hypothetical protein [Crocinitomix sp.]
MKKSEVELVIISAIVNGECAIKMKIYKNGTTCRFGVGGLPEIGLSLMSFVNDTRYFDPLMESITQEMLNTPLDYQEPTPNGYLEFAIVFFGESRNGDTGERADWAKVT